MGDEFRKSWWWWWKAFECGEEDDLDWNKLELEHTNQRRRWKGVTRREEKYILTGCCCYILLLFYSLNGTKKRIFSISGLRFNYRGIHVKLQGIKVWFSLHYYFKGEFIVILQRFLKLLVISNYVTKSVNKLNFPSSWIIYEFQLCNNFSMSYCIVICFNNSSILYCIAAINSETLRSVVIDLEGRFKCGRECE